MWKNLCDDEHDTHAMTVINRTFVGILVCFLSFGGFAIATRLGANVPPSSVSYGTEKAHPTATVFGD